MILSIEILTVPNGTAHLDNEVYQNDQLERRQLEQRSMVLQTALESAQEPQARRDGHCQADIVDDVEPEMTKICLRRHKAVYSFNFGDSGENGNERLHDWVLEDSDPHLAVPRQAIDRCIVHLLSVVIPSTCLSHLSSKKSYRTLLCGHLEGAEEGVALAVGRRHEVAHHDEEVA